MASSTDLLGLGLDVSPPKARSRAKKSKNSGSVAPEEKEIMQLITKLLLKTTRQVASLRACPLQSWMCPKASQCMVNLEEMKEKYHAKFEQLEREEQWKMAPRCLSLFQGILTGLVQTYQDEEGFDAIQAKIAAWSIHAKNLGLIEICQMELKHLEPQKAFHNHDRQKLELFILPGTHTANLWMACQTWFAKKHRLQKGVEPRGELERKLQVWLDGLKE